MSEACERASVSAGTGISMHSPSDQALSPPTILSFSPPALALPNLRSSQKRKKSFYCLVRAGILSPGFLHPCDVPLIRLVRIDLELAFPGFNSRLG